MTGLLHISSSPRGASSRSLALAAHFIRSHRRASPNRTITHWDLWGNGSVPDFGPAAAQAKMATVAGQALTVEQQAAYRRAAAAFSKFDAADRYLFSVPMWNGSIPYILKQFIDVVTQPGLAFELDAKTGYSGLLRNKKAAIIYTSSVWAPGLPPAFGDDHQSAYLEYWLRSVGIEEIVPLRLLPTSSDRDHLSEFKRTQDAITTVATGF